MSFHKLGGNAEFQKVYRGGRSRANRDLVMYVVKGDSGPSRYGFSVSKKVGNSVQRHRVTRLFREVVRRYDASVIEGCRIIIIARPTVKDKGLDEISEAIAGLYKAHRIWREQSE
ncbi:MAG: ribonuclease P protein component [Eubacterium sp.]|nr:ribonuclease P protein component [Eubacterium sp.]